MRRSIFLLAVLHLVANAIVLGVGYYWLGVAESRTSTLLWSILIALFLVIFAGCAYSAALAYFREHGAGSVGKAWRISFGNLIPFLLAAAALTALVLLLNAASADRLPARLEKWPLWAVEWVLLPVLFLPMMAEISHRGWRGFRAVGSLAGRWLFWVEAPLLLVLTIRAPMMLVSWVPQVQTFTLQALSFTARASLAYLLFGAGWLLLAFVTSAGTPRLTQSSTADSP